MLVVGDLLGVTWLSVLNHLVVIEIISTDGMNAAAAVSHVSLIWLTHIHVVHCPSTAMLNISGAEIL